MALGPPRGRASEKARPGARVAPLARIPGRGGSNMPGAGAAAHGADSGPGSTIIPRRRT